MPRTIQPTQRDFIQTVFFYTSFIYMIVIIMSYSLVTYSLDELKNVLLMTVTPFLLIGYILANIYLVLRGEAPLYENIPRFVLYPLGGYFGAIILSSVFSDFHWASIVWVTFQISFFTMFLCFAGSFSKERDLTNAIIIMCAIALYTTLLGALHYYRITTWWIRGFEGTDFDGKAFALLFQQIKFTRDIMSTFFNRDFFANFIVIILPISLSLFIGVKRIRHRVLAVITFLACGYCISLTYSKDTVLSLVVSLLIFAGLLVYIRVDWGKKENRRKAFFAVAVAVIVIAILLFVVAPVLDSTVLDNKLSRKYRTTIQSIERSLQSRGIIWRGAIGMFKDNPVFGGGPGTFRILFPEYRDPDYRDIRYGISYVTIYAHNEYLDVLSEVGAVGFVTFMVFLCSVYYVVVKIIFRAENDRLRIFALGLGAGLLGSLIAGFFSPSLRWTVCAVPLWSIMGIIVAQHNVSFPNKRHRFQHLALRKHTYPLIGILVLSLLFAYHSVSMGINWFKTAKHHCLGIRYMEGYEAYDQAIEHYKTALEYTPFYLTTYYKMGHSYMKLGKQIDALETYLSLEEYAPHYSNLHYNLGSTLSLLSAGKFSDGDINDLVKRGSIKRLMMSDDLLKKAIKSNKPFDKQAKQAVSDLFKNVSKQHLLISNEMNNEIKIKSMIGNVFMDQKEHEEAEKVWREIISLKRSSRFAREKLINTLYSAGKYEELKTFLFESARYEPHIATFRKTLLLLYTRHFGGVKEMFETLNAQLRENLNDVELKRMAAFFELEETKDIQSALSLLLEVHDQSPEDLITLYYLGQIHEKLKKPDEALTFYRKIIELKRNSSWSGKAWKRMVAFFELEQTQDIRENALSVALEFRDKTPKNLMMLYYLGQIHEKLQKPDEALTFYRTITGLRPRDRWAKKARKRIKQIR